MPTGPMTFTRKGFGFPVILQHRLMALMAGFEVLQFVFDVGSHVFCGEVSVSASTAVS